MSIGCDTKTVKHCPTTFKQMLRTGQGYKIGINNNPTEASAAFSAVYAAALVERGLVEQHQAWRRLVPEAEQRGQLRGHHRRSLDGPERCDEHRDLVGLPPGLGDQLAPGLQQELESRDPERRRRTRPTTPRRSTRAPRTRRQHACGRSTSTPPRGRTCGSRARHARSSFRTWWHITWRTRPAVKALPPAPKGITKFPTQAQLNKAKAVVAKYWPIEVTSGP